MNMLLRSEKLVQFFQAPLKHLRFAEARASQGHVREFSLLSLYLQEPIFDRVLNDIFDCENGTRLAESVL